MKPHTSPFYRELAVETKVLDATAGVVEYVASDQSVDSYGEVIRADGWRFTRFQKNAPFLNCHRSDSIDCVLGKVVDFEVRGGRLVETVQWAIDVPSNEMAQIGWGMTAAGYCKAVSVGFYPIRMVSKWDADKKPWSQQLQALGLREEDGVRAIYLEQEQIELSAVVVGANANAVAVAARAYKAGVLSDRDILFLSGEFARRPLNASAASLPGHAAKEAGAQAERRLRFIHEIERLVRAA